MFRKPSTLNGAPKLKPKYENKYQLKEEPTFEVKTKTEPKLEPKEETTEDSSAKRSLIVEQANVMQFKRENQEDKEVNLYVRGIDPRINDVELYQFFSMYG